MLYDSFNRPIQRPRLFGFGHTPANEPSRLTPDNSGVCDAIGFSIDIEDPEEEDETQETPYAF
jgi:hypothetical protein